MCLCVLLLLLCIAFAGVVVTFFCVLAHVVVYANMFLLVVMRCCVFDIDFVARRGLVWSCRVCAAVIEGRSGYGCEGCK